MTSLGFPKQFDKNVSFVISEFLVEKQYKFLEWIDLDKLEWKFTVQWLPESLLEKYIDKVNHHSCWDCVCLNEHAIRFIEKYSDTLHSSQSDKINWYYLAQNRNATHLLKLKDAKLFTEIQLAGIFSNPNAIEFIEKHYNKLRLNDSLLNSLCLNTNPKVHYLLESVGVEHFTQNTWRILSGNEFAFDTLQRITNNFTQYVERLDWKELSRNPRAIELLSRPEFQHQIDLEFLVRNKNGAQLLEQILSKMDIELISNQVWVGLCRYSHTIPILERFTQNLTQHLDKIDWLWLQANPNTVHLVELIMEKYPEKIKLYVLCQNKNAIHLINKLFLKSPEKFNRRCWYSLIQNPNAFELCQQNIDTIFSLFNSHIFYNHLSNNPNIVEFDHKTFNFLKHKLSNYIYEL
jgi:hypothetical protein